MTTAMLTDARVWALESAYVRVVLHARGQATPCEAPQNVASVRQSELVLDNFLGSDGRRQLARHIAGEILQFAELPAEFQGEGSGTLVGKFWEVRQEAVNSCDEVTEERAWKAFSLLLFLLFRRPGHASKVSKEDLRRRFDVFAHGTWEILVDDVVATLAVQVKPRSEGPLSAEQRGTWLPRRSCWVRSHVPVSALTGAPLAPGNDNTLNELQRKRPQQVVRELPEHVRAFVSETPLVVNKETLLKSLMSSPRGSSPGSGGCTVRAPQDVDG